ncbi:MAG: hypothetical protein L6R37_006120 [Teloschistes peruensis]|nr:MAG: hypothetical protein L6R37_006120 [Teloschistes peruensis]
MRASGSVLLRTLQASRQSLHPGIYVQWHCRSPPASTQFRRFLQDTPPNQPRIPDFAFAFDIDGVLLRSSSPLPLAPQTLRLLHDLRIPYILLTNGGGKTESARVAELQKLLGAEIDEGMFVQSHTPFASYIDHDSPFADLDSQGNGGKERKKLKNSTILVLGGDGDSCRKVAESYGFNSVITPADILLSHPPTWPLANPHLHKSHARPLPLPIYTPSTSSTPEPPDPKKHLRIHSVFVFADPHDWALDTQILIDVLRSENGILGTTGTTPFSSTKPPTQKQIPLHFSNPDILYASTHHLPRMGQGAFLASFLGAWNAVTASSNPRDPSTSPNNTPQTLDYTTIGKPSQTTFEFAERRLREHRRNLLSPTNNQSRKLNKVYMIGDNPASDIQGGNTYASPFSPKTEWDTILVRSGVFTDADPPTHTDQTPKTIQTTVWDAVTWALEREDYPTSTPTTPTTAPTTAPTAAPTATTDVEERKGVWAGVAWGRTIR